MEYLRIIAICIHTFLSISICDHSLGGLRKLLLYFFVFTRYFQLFLEKEKSIFPFADICERHGIWLHIDAAWGGGLLMSSQYKYKFQGIER